MTAPDKITISRKCAEYYRDFVNVVVRRAHDEGRTNIQAVPPWHYELEAALSSPAPTDRAQAIEEALEQIRQWIRAYPLSVFPEPDLLAAREALQSAGITLDAVSASAMRHVLDGVKEIIDSALLTSPQPSEDGWIKIDADHPLPDDLKVGDEIEYRIRRRVKQQSPSCLIDYPHEDIHVAYRRASGER